MNRRMFLKSGGAAIAVSIAAGAYWANTRTPTRALEPWKKAALGFGDARMDALAFALLSPSPHNRQPWKVTLVDGDRIDLYCDLNRRLPQTDPFDRQILLGLGCFVELLTMTAAHKGFTADVTEFPDGIPGQRLDEKRIATVTFRPDGAQKDPLFDHVFERRSVKEEFDFSKKISKVQLDELLSEPGALGTIDPAMVNQLSVQAYDAMKVEFLTPRTLKESADLMRIGKAEIEANPDGIDIGGAGMELLAKAGMLTSENFADANGKMVQDYLARLEPRYMSTVGYVWQESKTNTRAEQFQAGRRYVRLNLKATAMGISLHPVSQILQEYKEMEELYAKFHTTVGIAQPARGQMLARIGYGPSIAETPRWPVEAILAS